MSETYYPTVYKLYSTECPEHFYIGTTVNLIKYRLTQHRKDCFKYPERKVYTHLGQYPPETFTIEAICNHMCDSLSDAFKMETKYIRELKPTLNSIVSYMTKEERQEYYQQWKEEHYQQYIQYQKEYYQKNKEKHLKDHKERYINDEEFRAKKKAVAKKWREDNQERFKAYRNTEEYKKKKALVDKRSYEKNKTKRQAKKKERVNCPTCNKEMSRASLSRHQKSKHSEEGKQMVGCIKCKKEIRLITLAEHIRLHNTREKRLAKGKERTNCPKCGKNLSCSSLRYHLKHTHPE